MQSKQSIIVRSNLIDFDNRINQTRNSFDQVEQKSGAKPSDFVR